MWFLRFFPTRDKWRLSAFKSARIVALSLMPIAWDFSRHWLWLLLLAGWQWFGGLEPQYWFMTLTGIAAAADLERLRQRRKRSMLRLQDREYVSWSMTAWDWILLGFTVRIPAEDGGTRRAFSPKKTFLFVLGISFTILWELVEKSVKNGAVAAWTFLGELDAEYWTFIGAVCAYLFWRERLRQQNARLCVLNSQRTQGLPEDAYAYLSWSDNVALWLLRAVADRIAHLQGETEGEDGEPLGKCSGGSSLPASSES